MAVRTTYRDYDGVTREILMHGRTRALAERRLATAIRDRVYSGGGSELTPESRFSALAEAWLPRLRAAASVRPPCRHTDIISTGTFLRP
jgi:hypothetical protein